MKQTLSKILRVVTTVLMVASICIMLFTVVSVLTFNRTDRQLFGYRAFIVLSDSMSATDFSAGDLVLTRDVDPSTLQPGDIIAFTSTNTESYGQVVTHKIRSLTTTGSGEPGFITYGTTTDTNDEAVVTYMDVLGKYSGCLAGVGRFFNFLKTTPGYILCIFVPFALLILSQSMETVRLFRRYKSEQMEELQQEKDHSIIIVTHDAMVAAYTDRILFLHDGLVRDEYRCQKNGNDMDRIVDKFKMLSLKKGRIGRNV